MKPHFSAITYESQGFILPSVAGVQAGKDEKDNKTQQKSTF